MSRIRIFARTPCGWYCSLVFFELLNKTKTRKGLNHKGKHAGTHSHTDTCTHAHIQSFYLNCFITMPNHIHVLKSTTAVHAGKPLISFSLCHSPHLSFSLRLSLHLSLAPCLTLPLSSNLPLAQGGFLASLFHTSPILLPLLLPQRSKPRTQSRPSAPSLPPFASENNRQGPVARHQTTETLPWPSAAPELRHPGVAGHSFPQAAA